MRSLSKLLYEKSPTVQSRQGSDVISVIVPLTKDTFSIVISKRINERSDVILTIVEGNSLKRGTSRDIEMQSTLATEPSSATSIDVHIQSTGVREGLRVETF